MTDVQTDPFADKMRIIADLIVQIDDDTADYPDALDYVQVLRMIRDTADSALRDAVLNARGGNTSWDQIGRMLGTSRQAAWEKYGTPWNRP